MNGVARGGLFGSPLLTALIVWASIVYTRSYGTGAGVTVGQPLRESYRTGQPIHWQKVYNLPGFVYFDHSIHVQKGVGCTSCHGRLDEMSFVYQVPTLLMDWCLDCHRNPASQIHPRSEVFHM